jgi:polysaccharide export outer membrane protein
MNRIHSSAIPFDGCTRKPRMTAASRIKKAIRSAATLAIAAAAGFAAAPAMGQQTHRAAQAYPRLAQAKSPQPRIAEILQCQSCEICPPKPRANEPKALLGVHDEMCGPDGGEPRWNQWRPIPWDIFAQGEYIGPARTEHVPEYRLRVDDTIDFVYFISSNVSKNEYRLAVRDKIRIESSPTDEIQRIVEVQPDGTIILPFIEPVQAAKKTVTELKKELEKLYDEVYVNPIFTVTPEATNSKLTDLTNVVDVRAGNAGRTRTVKVSPDGTVQPPVIPTTYVVGLTLDEAKREIDERYATEFGNDVRVTLQLSQRAPRFAYVLGEVRNPNRFTLEGPTDLMQLLALAGGPVNGGNARQIVVFRRTDDWRLIATRLDIRGAAIVGARPIPADNIWIRDLDVVVVPKTPVQLTDDALELIFTRGVYRALPIFWNYQIPW